MLVYIVFEAPAYHPRIDGPKSALGKNNFYLGNGRTCHWIKVVYFGGLWRWISERGETAFAKLALLSDPPTISESTACIRTQKHISSDPAGPGCGVGQKSRCCCPKWLGKLNFTYICVPLSASGKSRISFIFTPSASDKPDYYSYILVAQSSPDNSCSFTHAFAGQSLPKCESPRC